MQVTQVERRNQINHNHPGAPNGLTFLNHKASLSQTVDPRATLTRPHPTGRSFHWGQNWDLKTTWERGRLGVVFL